MAAPNDATTVLNPGSGGDSMDESAPPRADGTTRKRPRVVQSGDADPNAVIDPQLSNGVFAQPVSNVLELQLLQQIVDLLTAVNAKLAVLSNTLP